MACLQNLNSVWASNHVNENHGEARIEAYMIATEIKRKKSSLPGDSEKASSNVWQSHFKGKNPK